MFDLNDAAGAMIELTRAARLTRDRYIRLSAFDATRGWGSIRLSFIVNRPPTRRASSSSGTRWAVARFNTPSSAYATQAPEGRRYE